MTDDQFISAFLACRLSPADFDHRGHLRIAWLLLQRHPRDQAVEEICEGIARIARHFGAPDKYNRTLSEALARLMAHAAARTPTASFEEFLAANPVFVTDVRGVLGHYYSPGLLHSTNAKQKFSMPDLQALP